MTEKKKRPITVNGYNRLHREIRELVDIQRPEILGKIADAAAEGDRSENAEYIYGRKKLRELDKRIRYLAKLLDNVRVVDPATLHGEQVCFGATVTVCDEDGIEKRWMIVGEGEADYKENTISWLSPVAKALNGKRVGDEVEVERPAGIIVYEIVNIEFIG